MASYKLSADNNENTRVPNKSKIIGILLMVFSSIAFISLFTGVLAFFKSFLLGIFGLSAYAVFIVVFVVGLALVNQKKYVMSKRYAISLILALFALLSIIDLAVMHGFTGNYGAYLAYSYSHKITAGGFIVGFLTAPFRYAFYEAGAFVVFILLFIVAVALIIDYFYFAKNYSENKKPVKVYVPTINSQDSGVTKSKKERRLELKNNKDKEEVAITLNSKTQKQNSELSAKEKLGLVKNGVKSTSSNISEQQPPIVSRTMNDVQPKKMSIKEYLLSKPSAVDLSYYSNFSNPSKQEVDKNVSQLKQQETTLVKPEKFVHDEFDGWSPPTHQSFNNKSFVIEDKDDEQKIIEDKPQLFVDEELEEQKDKPIPNKEVDIISKLEEDVLKSLNNPDSIDINKDAVSPETSRRRGAFSQINIEQSQIQSHSKEPIEKPITPLVKKKNVYKKPETSIFNTVTINPDELNSDIVEKRAQLEYALETFNVPAKVIAVIIGPAVTRYELEMPPGISVKKLLAHAEDIAYTLASNGDVRIEAPIPGRSAVGVEVPNDKIATVGIKDILESREFNQTKSQLPVALGKDISGTIRICDLVKMPHLLVAGATNSGKSVCLNAIIVSLIYRNSPDDLKLILIDPKRVEFSMYNDLPHLVMPKVITETDKAINSLAWAVDEMERRFVLLQSTCCRNIQEYNNLSDVISGQVPKMTYVVIIIDELADLMTLSKKEVEEKILRLAQKARAAGIHMVLATQRPSVDVITGLIKANFPSRISFYLTSFTDSKTILDQGGADKLLGKGDMLYRPSDLAFPVRIQGCFMTGEEVLSFVSFIKDNNNYDYDADIALSINAPKQSNVSELVDGVQENGFDELMPQALRLVIENGQASITILQRKLMIGYPRAAKIIDQMETAGFISKSDGSKPRSVYMSIEQWEEKFKKD